MYTTSDLKRGLILDFDGGPHVVENLHVSSPQARGASTIFKVRLRNLKTRQKVDKSFRSGDTFGVPNFQKRPIQFLYKDTEAYHFMDSETFDQFHFQVEDLEWESKFLVEEMAGLKSLVYNEEIIGLELPPTVALKIAECAPAVRGNSATARTKPATLETGLVVLVPEHTSPDERLNVDTRTGESLGRANK